MVEVECPLCSETIDLGNAEDGVYECPHCGDEFLWENDDYDENLDDYTSKYEKNLIEDKIRQLLKKKVSKKDFKFPLRVGNLKARRQFYPELITVALVFGLFAIVRPLEFVGLLALYAIIFIVRKIYLGAKYLKRRREFTEGTLDPELLRGTGLVIFPDLTAKLVAKSWIPAYEFEADDIEKIVLDETIYPGSLFIKSRYEFELYIHLHGFHALTLYGFNENDSIDIVKKMISVYDVDLDYKYRVISSNDGGDGGSGGGG